MADQLCLQTVWPPGVARGHSGPPRSPEPRCRGCSRAPPGPARAPEVSGTRPRAVTPSCSREQPRLLPSQAAGGPRAVPACSPPGSAPRGPAAACWNPDPSPRPSAGSREPAGGRGQGRSMPGQACPVASILRLGRSLSLSRSSPGSPGARAPPRAAASWSSPGQGWLLRTSRS